MTAETPIGPVCSICEEYEAIGSLMNLADYTTTRFCALCGPGFLGVILEALSGADTTPDPEPADPEPPAAEQVTAAAEAAADQAIAAGQEPETQTGTGWPGTANVVKSTHGHRKTGQAADNAGQ